MTVKLKDFTFDTVKDFIEYTEQNYLPLLDKLGSNEYLGVKERQTITFLYNDLVSFVNNAMEV